MKIIVDAMGGDFAPLAPVKGALMAQEKYGVDIVLTGKTEEIEGPAAVRLQGAPQGHGDRQRDRGGRDLRRSGDGL
ncbi:MAG: hypothetical protein V8T17_09160 [Oscillospiraceae bacterium]